jgi:MFS transporter, ACS family, solute carrier family 17 (sodium-dependent inorganic phosphate cotransporter), member 9
MIGILTLCWVYYFRTYVMNKSRLRLMSKDGEIKSNDSIIGLNHATASLTSSASSSNSNNVPWMEFLNKPSFWSLIIAHVCQNNAYYILLTWLPTYFQENYPGSKVNITFYFIFQTKHYDLFLKGWIFNVVPWLISMPSTIFAGWLADKLITKSKI